MELFEAQGLLGYFGYYTGSIDNLDGPKTKAAVKSFQSDYGNDLVVDGVVGSTTGDALRQAFKDGWKKPEAKTESVSPETAAKVSAADSDAPDWWKYLTYFKRSDPYIACSCGKCGGFPVEPSMKLMYLADDVREHFHRAMIPTSTVRCVSHNAEVGGVPNSRHTQGKAMDFYIPGISAQAIMDYLHSRKDCRYAYNINGPYVHMDVE